MADHLIDYPCFNWYCDRILKKNANGTHLLNEYNCLCLQVNPIVVNLARCTQYNIR